MMSASSRFRSIAFVASTLMAVPLAGYASTEARVESLTFDVLLNDKPIGQHQFTIREEANRRIVRSEAEFDVQVLFVPVFSYRHSNTEQWADGCLQRIESDTDSNGTHYRVVGKEQANEFTVETQDSRQAYAGDCVMSFAYWDRRVLGQDRLLNAQTGELIDVDIRPLSQETIEFDGRRIPVEAYRIVARDKGVDIRVFYERDSGDWVALESVLEKGRVMRYRPKGQQVAGGSPAGQ